MNLNILKYGYYREYNPGDGSLYDHSTAYLRAAGIFGIFLEGSEHYYNLLDENRTYSKNAKYGDTMVSIEGDLLDIMPFGIDPNLDCSIDDILLLMPRKIVRNMSTLPKANTEKVLQLL